MKTGVKFKQGWMGRSIGDVDFGLAPGIMATLVRCGTADYHEEAQAADGGRELTETRRSRRTRSAQPVGTDEKDTL